MPGVWLTIWLMEVVIEPADVFRIIYAILQVRRCIPLQNGSEYENEKRLGGQIARMVRTIGVRRGLEFKQLTNVEAAVFMAVVLEISFKALVLGWLANKPWAYKGGKGNKLRYTVWRGPCQTPHREREGRPMYACH